MITRVNKGKMVQLKICIMNVFERMVHVWFKKKSQVVVLGISFLICSLFSLYFYKKIDTFPNYLSGEGLLNSIPVGNIAFYMPVKSLFEALFTFHMSFGERLAFSILYFSATYLLVYWLAVLLISPLGGILAVLITAMGHVTEPLFNISVLLIAIFLVLRAEYYTAARNVLLGLAIGFSIFYRSVFVFLPLLIVLADVVFAPDRLQVLVKRSFPLIAISYSSILPWCLMNWLRTKTFIPLENGGADTNIISGALGTVYTVEGNVVQAIGGHVGMGSKLWAFSYVFSHPISYILAVIHRLYAVYGFYPIPCLLMLCGIIMLRRNRCYTFAWLLVVYFISIHVLFSIEARYFEPIYPLMAVLAVWPLAFISHNTAKDAVAKTAGLCAVIIFIPLFLFELFTEAKVLSYPVKPGGPAIGDVRAAIVRNPSDPWLYIKLAQMQLGVKDYQSAMASCNTAMRLNGGLDESHTYILAHLYNTLAVATAKGQQILGQPLREDNATLKVFVYALQMDSGKLPRALSDSYENYIRSHAVVRSASTGVELALQARLVQADVGYIDNFIGDLEVLPIAQQDKIVGAVDDLCSAGKVTEPGLCGSIYKGIENDGYAGPLADIFCVNARHRRLLIESLSIKSEAQRKDTARRLLSSGNAYAKSVGLQIYRDTVAVRRVSADEFINAAMVENSFGHIIQTRKMLAKAEQFNPSPREMKQMALIYQHLGDYAKTITLLTGVIARESNNSQDYADRGVALFFAGKALLAKRDFETALRISPCNLSASMSLGYIYESGKKSRKAAEIYDAALHAQCPGADKGIVSQLISARAKLRY